jgi:hypothetical protein
MKRLLALFALALVAGVALGEEIVLKDGTKIVGHMTAINGDKIEVETSYGKVQLNRTDIVSISFPENSSAKAADTAPPAKADLPKIDETLNGTQYVNRTGRFTLTLPPDWVIAETLRHAPTTMAGLKSKDNMRYVIVTQEEYPGSLESYKELSMINARRTLSNFEEIANSSANIDGKAGLIVFYRGVLSKSGNLPVEFITAIIPSGSTYTRVSAWCVEPLFHDMQPAFEKLVNSYHSTAGAGGK